MLGFDTHTTNTCKRFRKKLHALARISEFMSIRVNKDYVSSFTEFLEKEISTTIHNRNIQLLTIEFCKVKNGFLPTFINEIFVEIAQHYYDSGKELNSREIMLKIFTTELKL